MKPAFKKPAAVAVVALFVSSGLGIWSYKRAISHRGTQTPTAAGPVAPSPLAPASIPATMPHLGSEPAESRLGKSSNSAAEPISSSAPPANDTRGASPPAPPKECLAISYHHKPTSGHANVGSCSQHRNAIPIPLGSDQRPLKPKSICVRVDGTPVHFENAGNRLVIGAVAGPASTISVNYCLSNAGCGGDCTVPKDAFLDALSGGDSNGVESGQWDPSNAGENTDVAREIGGEVEQELGARPGGGEAALFEGWTEVSEDRACGKKVADAAQGGKA